MSKLRDFDYNCEPWAKGAFEVQGPTISATKSPPQSLVPSHAGHQPGRPTQLFIEIFSSRTLLFESQPEEAGHHQVEQGGVTISWRHD